MNNVKFYRSVCGLTQKEAADKLGISLNSFSNKELGKTEFTKSEMKTFLGLVSLKISNVSINDIFFSEKLQKLHIERV